MMSPRFRYVNTVCILIVLNLAATISHIIQTQIENSILPENSVSFEEFAKCWSDSNSSCVKAVEEILDRNGDIQLTDSLVIEKLSNETTVYEESQMPTRKEEGRADPTDQVMENIGRLLKSRSLKFTLWDLMTIRMARSKDQPGSLEFTLDSIPVAAEGKSQRMGKVIVPLVLGFKLTGALLLAISTVKVFLIKAFVLSKLALLAALYLVVKKLLAAVGVQHHPYLYSKHQLPQYFHGGLEAGIPADYGYTPYHGGYGGQYPTAHEYGQYPNPYHAQYPVSNGGAEGAGAGGGAEDLQAHFSHNNVASVQPDATHRNGSRILARADVPGVQRGVYGLVKSSAHRVPVNTYRKLVSTGRSLSS